MVDTADHLVRLDPLGVLVSESHRFAALPGVPVATLAGEPLLLAEQQRAPEFNQFVIELCRSVGFIPTVHHGTVESIRAGVDLVAQQATRFSLPSAGDTGARHFAVAPRLNRFDVGAGGYIPPSYHRPNSITTNQRHHVVGAYHA